MREIKFRAWDKKNKKMLYPGNEWYDICCGAIEGVLAIPHSSVYDGVENKSKEWIPMQYTGLKDKNGREIYEGDIVRFKDWWDEEMVGEVRYSEKDMAFTIVNDFWDGFPIMYADDLEVIGNIYENPELLEEAEND